jgi:hypothetical protein
VATLAEPLRELVDLACAATGARVDVLAARLGLALVPGWRGYADIAVPPPGVAGIRIGLDGDRGPVRFVEIDIPDDVSLALDDLAAGWHDPQVYEPDDVGDPERLIFEVTPAASPRVCRVAVDLRPETGDGRRLVSRVGVLP